MPPSPPLKQILAVLALCALLGVALTWPLATRIASDLPGGAHKDGLEDAYQNVWNLWWTLEALRRPANLWVTDRFFFPERPNLLYHTLSPINTLLAAPITALWGPIAGFNAVALASFALGGLGMWLLARERTGPAPALLASIVYVASPFHLAAIVTDGQLQIFAHHWLPFYVYFLLRALRPQGRRRDAALAGVFLVLTAWTDWYYTLFLMIFSVCAAAWRAALAISKENAPEQRIAPGSLGFSPPPAVLRSLLVPGLIIGAVFALGAGPLIVPMLVEAGRSDYMRTLPAADPFRLSADLLAYVVPARIQALWGAAPWSWGVSFDVNRRFFVGLTVVLLAAVALARRPASRPWGLAALAFATLSLGATLRVNGVDTGFPLPYALLERLPIFSLTRQPDRFNVLVTIALGVLAAYGAEALASATTDDRRQTTDDRPPTDAIMHAVVRRRSSVVSPAIALLAAALILLEFWPAPIVTRAPAVPPYLATLPRGEGAIVEYPFHPEITYRDAERMLFQTRHGHPISGGYHSRAYPQPQLGLPALRDLRAGSLGGDIILGESSWASSLRTLGYTRIIGYKQQPLGPLSLRPEDEAPFRALVEAGLGVGGPAYEDAWLIAYDVPEAPPSHMLQIREGWGPVEQGAGERYRWLPEQAELGLITPAPGAYDFSFTAIPAGGPRTLRLTHAGGSIDLPLSSERRSYRLLLELPAGSTVIGLSTVEPPTTGDALERNGDMRSISARFSGLRLTLVGQD
jgi:hypothetical protein